MTVVRVTEVPGGTGGGFAARVAFGDQAEYAVTVTVSDDAERERLLGWYFEEHLRFPFLDRDLERSAVAALREYGEGLFGQVFGGAAAHDYRRLREQGFDGCRVEVTGSAGFHRLHWEALRDPELDSPLAVRVPVTRRVALLPSRFDLPAGQPTLNILLVTARPFGGQDAGYRTISRPLLDALRQASLPVTVDLVRPGTWEALRDRLRETREHSGSGWYQVAHFDMHGGFSEYEQLDEQRSAGTLMFAGPRVEPFEGKRPFLFFETPQAGKAAAVPAEAIAELLAEHRVPVAVLNACQSAMTGESEAGLAQHLVEAGVRSAVGMAWSVTVSAAERAMPVLYGRLARGADPVEALHAARQALHDEPARRAYFDQDLDLQDWVLPVGFAQQRISLNLRPMDDSEQTAFYQREADAGDEPATEYGFVGRDLDIQAAERLLLARADSNELLVQGMAGAGKSTFLLHLGWWWQRTGLVDQVLRFSWEDRAWTAAQIVREVRSRLLDPAENARADLMPASAQLEQVAGLLRASRHLLVLDNFESVTAAPAAIPHALDPAERAHLRTLLSRLKGGRTLVLIGSRQGEEWLAPDTFGDGAYPLPGLDPQAASALTDRILRRHRAQHWLDDQAERQALDNLTTLLGGYPLPMSVVLPALATTAPSQVLADLQSGAPDADPAQQITAAIEYSHGRLNPVLQEALLLLAPFTAVIPPTEMLAAYRRFLSQARGAGTGRTPGLDQAVAEAVRVGLAAPHPQLPGWVQVQPVLPYFLRTRLRDRPALQETVSRAHYQLCTHIGRQLHELLTSSKDPQGQAAGQAATRATYANLTAALTWALQAAQPIQGLIRPLDEYLKQAGQQATRRQLLDDAIAAYPQPPGKEQQWELALLHNLAGVAALDQRRPGDACSHHEAGLQLLKAVGDRRSQGLNYHQLGTAELEQRRFEEAEDAYRQALEISEELGDPHSAALTRHQLGRLAQEQQQYKEARAAYRQALKIFEESRDRHSAARTRHQLGRLAQEQQQFKKAETAYRQALRIFEDFGDRQSAAETHHNLGMVVQEQRRFGEAQAAYRRALEIKLELGDRHSAALTYSQIGMTALEQGRFEEAEDAYRQALEIFEEFSDRHSAAGTRHNLGGVAQKQGRFEEAETAYRQALEIYKDKSDPRQASVTATQFGLLLAETGRHLEAAATLLNAALLRYHATGRWDPKDLRNLKRERAAIGLDPFERLTAANVPEDLRTSLNSGIEGTEKP